VSSSSVVTVPLPSAYSRRSASTTSSWPIAWVIPSACPMVSTCSSASAVGEADTAVKREPVGVLSNMSVIRPVGTEGSISPCASANESSTTIRSGFSISTKSQRPWNRSPSGEVIQ